MHLNKIFDKYRANDFFKSVTVLVGGTAAAQLLLVLILPLLTRLYSPQDFNMLSVYLGLLSIFSVVATLRFELAISLPEDDLEAMHLLGLGIGFSFLTALVVGVGLLITSESLAAWLGQPSLAGCFFVLPVGVFLAGAYSALQFWMGRRKRFSVIAKTKVQQAVSASAVQLSYGGLFVGPLGLILGQTINNGAGAVGLLVRCVRNDRELLKALCFKQLGKTFAKYNRFPKYSTLEALANNASIQVPVIIIAGLAIGPEAGFLLLAMQIMQAPISLIGSAVSQVYISNAPEKMRDGRLGEFTANTLSGIIKVGILPLIIGGVAAPYVFSIVFGEAWDRTGEIIVYMIPWIVMQLLVSPISMVLHTTNNQPIALMLQVFGLILRVGVVCGVAVTGAGCLTETYALTGFIFYFIYFLIVLRVAGINLSDVIKRNPYVLLVAMIIYLAQCLMMVSHWFLR
ncbi:MULTISPECIES: oligosaccharide flippase family protein [Pseudomonas]|uniref:oligosaccharide flippase family protein n=1 Tax=Pseudomonas TaxID=286 RepID=UPI001BE924EE|nr:MULTISPECIES: oligosaccharide flippase family protein [Pseudomonas]MBT2342223.1 oligosaccharide flippase family protein [Pseudomonas fluorescens]MCD4528998.1 oligosaccharide flippase family protein [Pseudomonas sp. C3-2018]